MATLSISRKSQRESTPSSSISRNPYDTPIRRKVSTTDLPEERLRIALKGAEYFAASAAIDLHNGDRDELAEHLQQLRQIVIAGLQAYKDLPALEWPNTATREAFAASAAEWGRDHRGRAS